MADHGLDGFGEDRGYPAFLFLLGGGAGWWVEAAFRSACQGRWVDPGLLAGPFLPIYGFGAVLVKYLCSHRSALAAYGKIVLFSTALEYAASLFCERVFHRLLWDYSYLPLSVGTRVSLAFSLVWGLLGLAFLLGVEPGLHRFYRRHRRWASAAARLGASAVALDFLVSAAASIL